MDRQMTTQPTNLNNHKSKKMDQTSNANLERLKKGNKRFLEGNTLPRKNRPEQFKNSQSPHTIILTCSDSRVPPEIIFDQDLGDLFIIRLAGNIPTREAIGSIEYAVHHLKAETLLVLGHSKCGAVGATLDHVQNGSPLTPCLTQVVSPIISSAIQAINGEEDDLLEKCIEYNIDNAQSIILETSNLLQKYVSEKKLNISGAKYDLASGKVLFL